jgi:ABC-type sugar transport system permease subunit
MGYSLCRLACKNRHFRPTILQISFYAYYDTAHSSLAQCDELVYRSKNFPFDSFPFWCVCILLYPKITSKYQYKKTLTISMKKTILKELMWFIIASVLAVPLSFVFLGLLKLTSANPGLNEVEKVFTVQLFMIGWLVMFICVYIVRIVVKALLKLVGVHDATSGNP